MKLIWTNAIKINYVTKKMKLSIYQIFWKKKMDTRIDQATIKYLTEAVGEQLSNAFAEAICRKPKDAIEFIGNYLVEASKEFEAHLS